MPPVSLAPWTFEAPASVDQADGTMGKTVVRGERGLDAIGAARKWPRLPERPDFPDGVSEVQLIRGSVGVLGPQTLTVGEIAVDVLPAGEEHTAIGEHLGAEV